MTWLAALWICKAISIEILPKPYQTFTCFLWNGHKNTQARCKVYSNLSSVQQQLTFVLVLIFINLEHFSCPTLVFTLFKLWKGKYWLEVRCELFVKNNTAMLIWTHICSSLINSKLVLWSHTNFNLKSIEIEKFFPYNWKPNFESFLTIWC